MKKKETQYGEVIKGFTLLKVERFYDEKKQEDYQICIDNFAIFTFPIKPISQNKHNEETEVFTNWVYSAMQVSKKFLFTPTLGAKIFEAITSDEDWNENKEKKYSQDMAFFVFEKAGKLIEK
jgi:hypothetical protein